ncbi:hypothetical protein C8N24_0341 [Solirubrobacter pauli]|uniref:Uncharacterized protein n=1 Tax=Solirubrobacter pauli TaxID=166793 RepID=A0A660L842_9ACTN|nr:hypothetical protein [Solirubrobacter pauli]RKQ90536.1 hypothetical protein C8N24_0341 [Solirubrobacter pauli]
MTATLFDTDTPTPAAAQAPESAAPTIEHRLDRRTITATWTLGEPFPAEGISDETHQRVVVLTCDHDSNRNGFTATLRVQHDIYRHGRHFATTFALFQDPMQRLAGEPIVRYNAKRLHAFFDTTLERVNAARTRRLRRAVHGTDHVGVAPPPGDTADRGWPRPPARETLAVVDWIEQIAEAAVTVYHRGELPYDDVEHAAIIIEALGVEEDLERRIETVANALRATRTTAPGPKARPS